MNSIFQSALLFCGLQGAYSAHFMFMKSYSLAVKFKMCKTTLTIFFNRRNPQNALYGNISKKRHTTQMFTCIFWSYDCLRPLTLTCIRYSIYKNFKTVKSIIKTWIHIEGFIKNTGTDSIPSLTFKRLTIGGCFCFTKCQNKYEPLPN